MQPITQKFSAVTAAAVLAMSTALLAPAPGYAATPAGVRTWSAGTLAAGQSKSFVWNNANSDIYQANAGGTRTGNSNAPCHLSVTDLSYTRAASGARKFRLTVRNTDSVSCDGTVYLALLKADQSASTGPLNAGEAKTWYWHNADLKNLVYAAGVTPDTPGDGTCKLAVTWTSRVTSSGESQFSWTVRNSGLVACAGQWRLGWLPVNTTTAFPDDDPPTAPGLQSSLTTPISDPFRVYVFGLVPNRIGTGDCEWGPTHVALNGDPAAPTPGAQRDIGFINVGSTPCVIHAVTVAYIR